MSIPNDVRIFPIGDSALTVEFGTAISEDLNNWAIALAADLTQHPFEGFIEAVPAYASTTIFYDVVRTRQAYSEFATAYAAVTDLVQEKLKSIGGTAGTGRIREVSIPVEFGGEAGPDLGSLAEFAEMSEREVINIFTSLTYRVYMLGFLPGFSYMGEVDERIAMPRKDSPRTDVREGSVGIAGRQTGIYSLDSPGGWQIIGRTSLRMFTPDADDPTFLHPGEVVRFVAI